MPSSLLISLHPKAILVRKGKQIIGIEIHSKRLTFDHLSKGMHRALNLLRRRPVHEDILEHTVMNVDGKEELAVLYYIISSLASIGGLCYTVSRGSRHLMTFVPTSPNYRPDESSLNPKNHYALSRFAYLHRDGNQVVLKSPVSHSSAYVYSGEAIRFLLMLKRPFKREQLRKEETLLNLLHRHHFLESIEQSNLLQWEFHDLLFHAASRDGRTLKPFGGTYRFENKIEPLSAIKQKPSGESFALWKPEMKRLIHRDKPFSVVLEERKSIRSYDDRNPITLKQLGEFLYRVGRIKGIHPQNPTFGLKYEITTRPYPGGGACYELELYAIIRSCRDIAPGLYYYDPREHRLHKISEPSPDTDQLLQDARNANGEVVPQILICIAARFARVSWKYEAMAYATILKDVGVLYQTMYLVATAMDLAPCALGGGNSDLFARAAGTDYYAETSVGEFMIGSKKPKRPR